MVRPENAGIKKAIAGKQAAKTMKVNPATGEAATSKSNGTAKATAKAAPVAKPAAKATAPVKAKATAKNGTSKAQTVRDYLDANPDARPADVAKATGVDAAYVWDIRAAAQRKSAKEAAATKTSKAAKA